MEHPNYESDLIVPKTGKLYGKYRGIVVGVDDPTERGRYQVHVYNVDHWQDEKGKHQLLTADRLLKLKDGGDSLPKLTEKEKKDGKKDPRSEFKYPWAENVAYAGKLAGDVPFYSIGDVVWVEFEGGSRDHRLIVGGWVSRSLGLNDQPNQIGSEYPESRYKWVRADRTGNTVELSGMGDEGWVRVSSGLERLTTFRFDDSVRLETIGTVGIEGGAVSVRGGSQGVFIAGCDVLIQACAKKPDDISPGTDPGADLGTPSQALLGLYSNWDADLYARDELWVGQYADRKVTPLAGTDGIRTWKQTRLVTVGPEYLILGTVCLETKKAYNSLYVADAVRTKDTLAVDVEGRDYVCLRAGPDNEVGGRLGLYSNFDAELWAHDFVWIGQYKNPDAPPCQTRFTLIHSKIIYVGACPPGSPESPLAPAGTLPTREVFVNARDWIVVRTCGAKDHPPYPYCPEDEGMALAWGKGDIVVWAARDLILCANRNVKICGPTHRDPVYNVRFHDCKIQITFTECPPYEWVTVGDVRSCCCSSSGSSGSAGSSTGSTPSVPPPTSDGSSAGSLDADHCYWLTSALWNCETETASVTPGQIYQCGQPPGVPLDQWYLHHKGTKTCTLYMWRKGDPCPDAAAPKRLARRTGDDAASLLTRDVPAPPESTASGSSSSSSSSDGAGGGGPGGGGSSSDDDDAVSPPDGGECDTTTIPPLPPAPTKAQAMAAGCCPGYSYGSSDSSGGSSGASTPTTPSGSGGSTPPSDGSDGTGNCDCPVELDVTVDKCNLTITVKVGSKSATKTVKVPCCCGSTDDTTTTPSDGSHPTSGSTPEPELLYLLVPCDDEGPIIASKTDFSDILAAHKTVVYNGKCYTVANTIANDGTGIDTPTETQIYNTCEQCGNRSSAGSVPASEPSTPPSEPASDDSGGSTPPPIGCPGGEALRHVRRCDTGALTTYLTVTGEPIKFKYIGTGVPAATGLCFFVNCTDPVVNDTTGYQIMGVPNRTAIENCADPTCANPADPDDLGDDGTPGIGGGPGGGSGSSDGSSTDEISVSTGSDDGGSEDASSDDTGSDGGSDGGSAGPDTGVVGGFEELALGEGGTAEGPVGEWTLTSAFVSANNSPYSTGTAATPDGANFIGIVNGGFADRTVNLPVGSYTLSLYAANRQNYGGVQTIGVAVNGSVLAEITPPVGVWAYYTVMVTIPSSGDHTLRLQGQNVTGDNTAFVDGVTVTPVAPDVSSSGPGESSSDGPPPTSAAFVGRDDSTQGNWIGTYGDRGYNTAGFGSYTAGSSSITPTGTNSFNMWGPTAGEGKALQVPPDGTTRTLDIWYTPYEMQFAVTADAYPVDVSVYMLDFDGYGPRSGVVSVENLDTAELLDTQNVADMGGGSWVTWRVTGPVLVRVGNTNMSSNIAALGVFLSTPPVPSMLTVVTPTGGTAYTEGDVVTFSFARVNVPPDETVFVRRTSDGAVVAETTGDAVNVTVSAADGAYYVASAGGVISESVYITVIPASASDSSGSASGDGGGSSS